MTADELKIGMLLVCALFMFAAGVRLTRGAAPEDRVMVVLAFLVFGGLQLVSTYMLAFPCGDRGLPMSERYMACPP